MDFTLGSKPTYCDDNRLGPIYIKNCDPTEPKQVLRAARNVETSCFEAISTNPILIYRKRWMKEKGVKGGAVLYLWDRHGVSAPNVQHKRSDELRVTEVINIRRRDIDFDNGEITARWQKNKKWKNRTVPMHEDLAMPLSPYVDGLDRDEKVFDFTHQTWYNICQRHLGVGPHALRHSFAVHYLRTTDDAIRIVKLSRQLGHSNARTMMEYLKVVPKDLRSTLDKIDF